MASASYLEDSHLLSREFALLVGPDGFVLEADPRAGRLLGLEKGALLSRHLAAGTEGKLQALLARAALEPVEDWEIPFVCRGSVATVLVRTRPSMHGIAFVGSLVPADFGSSVQHVQDAMSEIVTLHRELSRQRSELAGQEHTISNQRGELTRVKTELDESSKGVLVLHSELAEKADALRVSAELAMRVVSNVSHEFRTPLHAILGLSKLLLDRVDGPLSSEQDQQVRFIRSAAEELSQLVDDVLDISKMEAGKTTLRTEKFTVSEFLFALRGMMRPLVTNPEVELVVETIDEHLEANTDQAKLGQILRNLVSNALKFTEQGSVRVATSVKGGELRISVTDTGIGIAPEHHDRVFEEFAQVESRLQRKVKGTGLGLPLARKLASMLGGTLTLESAPGQGSTFHLDIPLVHPEVQQYEVLRERGDRLDPTLAPVLVLEDDRKTMFVYERFLSLAGFQVLPTRTIDEARETLRRVRPAAIVLDVMLEGTSSWTFLQDLKSSPETRDIPVLVVTVMNRELQARALGADEFWLKPVDQERLVRKLKAIAQPSGAAKVLVIDDDPAARYLVKKHLAHTPFSVFEAASGHAGVAMAQQVQPDAILLDFQLQEMTAFDVLDRLKADPRTRAIPVIINTSQVLPEEERRRLAEQTEAILHKEHLTREIAIHRIRDALRKAGLGTPPSA